MELAAIAAFLTSHAKHHAPQVICRHIVGYVLIKNAIAATATRSAAATVSVMKVRLLQVQLHVHATLLTVELLRAICARLVILAVTDVTREI